MFTKDVSANVSLYGQEQCTCTTESSAMGRR